MSDPSNPNLPADVSLLLRAHAEQQWLSGEVVPVVRQIETRERPGETREPLPEDQVPAAMAYLEVVWMEALSRARETEGARRRFDDIERPDRSLPGKVRRYHDAVRVLREAVARRVARLLAVPAETLIERGTPGAWGALHDLTR
jgi:hypothetical protein